MSDDLYDFDNTPSYTPYNNTGSTDYNNNSNSYTNASSHDNMYNSNNTAYTTRQNASSPGSSAVTSNIPTIKTNMDSMAFTTDPTSMDDHTSPAAPPASPIFDSHPLGFSNVQVTLTVPSAWKHGQLTKTIETQTQELRTNEADTQTTTNRDVSVQTSDHGAGSGIDPNGAVYSGFDKWTPQEEGLSYFLKRSTVAMEQQLHRNDASHAFDDYDMGNNRDDVRLTCLHVLAPTTMQNVKTVAQVLAEERRENDRHHDGGGRGAGSKSSSGRNPRRATSEEGHGGLDLHSTSMSWNSTGSVLAVAFGRLDESGWCNITRAGCCLFHVFQRDFDASKPQTVLETSSYLMSVCCHPEIPSLVVGGTFNGEVMVCCGAF